MVGNIRLIVVFVFLGICNAMATYNPTFSTGGFFANPNSNREVYSLNNAWKFHKGDIKNAYESNFDDSNWDIVNLPNGLEYLPDNASGGVNYQGISWYRKTAKYPKQISGKKLFLYFEGIMGRSKIYVNGTLLKEHFGGYLPVIVDVTKYINFDKENIIAVMTDNSDDPSFPPGKPQGELDFTYFGGIYRDCWLIAHSNIYITDPNYENEVAGGGLFVAFKEVTKQKADILLKSHIRNESDSKFEGYIKYQITSLDGKLIKEKKQTIEIAKNNAESFSTSMSIEKPNVWTPEKPTLHYVNVRIEDKSGNEIDSFRQRIGIRHIEFKGKDGFWLNGELYTKPLIGANRHQDFAVIGNALPNSIHWRDVKKLRDLDFKIIRSAHFVQDPAFMDACDELGMFIIVTTPGWHWWSKKAEFGKRVYSDIRNMVRRDRNHPCVLLWEPILNETVYPADFAKNAHDCVIEEYPYGAYPACDGIANGAEFYDVQYPFGVKRDDKKTYFTREWGDNVDNWSDQNSISRCAKSFGEIPMLEQAKWYFNIISKNLYNSAPRHLGGCLWHPFDHQRGYHPDPFYGGLMDAYRQPKTSYTALEAFRPIEQTNPFAAGGPYLYIANEMTPFSPSDVSVYTNCDEVRLWVYDSEKPIIKKITSTPKSSIAKNVVFENILKWSELRTKYVRGSKENKDKAYIVAEGIIDDKVVATTKKIPTGKVDRIIMWVDNEDMELNADGSDKVVVVAGVADKNGNIKRLDTHSIAFSIEGEGVFVTNSKCDITSKQTIWGTAPVIVQSTNKAGKITVKARVSNPGIHQPVSGQITIETIPDKKKNICDTKLCAIEKSTNNSTNITSEDSAKDKEIMRLKKIITDMRIKKTEDEQDYFESNANL